MCLLVVKPEGVEFNHTIASLRSIWRFNHDGFGMANPVEEPGKLRIYKTTDWDCQLEAIAKIDPAKWAVLHWRAGSGGGNTLENVHPFKCGNHWLFQNGVCSTVRPTMTMSDTRVMASRFQRAKDLKDYLNEYEPWSHWVMASSKGYKILDPKRGHWHNGVWYSNMIWRYSFT